jgi:hypothetical protein
MRAPRNHSRGPATAEQAANLIRKVDRLLVVTGRILRAVERNNGRKPKRKAAV